VGELGRAEGENDVHVHLEEEGGREREREGGREEGPVEGEKYPAGGGSK
jgi:hypothetical protein